MSQRNPIAVLNEKIEKLQVARATTSNPACQFELEHQIKEAIEQKSEIEKTKNKEIEREPGIRSISPMRISHGVSDLFGREQEFDELEKAWGNPFIHVLTIVAWGGVGKTALVGKWAAELAQRDYDGARYFDWTFHSQGVREQGSGSTSAATFIAAALEFFGDGELARSAVHPWDKGSRLAQLIAQERTLLVLDGMESLQNSPSMPDVVRGTLKDPGVEALLKGLAQRNPGLCVVTTRGRVADLAPFRDTTSPERVLEHLSCDASIELLRFLGVWGPDADFRSLVVEIDGHALTLNLLGRYLKKAHSGDIRRRDFVRIEKADAKIQGGRAFKVMAAYERWLSEGGEDGAQALAVLRLLGLFDRPADPDCLMVLRRDPVISGLTEQLSGIADDDWNLAITSLEDCGLVTQAEKMQLGMQNAAADVGLDSHPLVREYFATQLREHGEEGWRSAHLRLYEHIKGKTKDRPDTLEELEPLFHAVAHGCQAGVAELAYNEVYFKRIMRGGEYFCTKKLGGVSASLGSLACFFKKQWTVVVDGFDDEQTALLLHQAASHLDHLGRTYEALEAVHASLNLANSVKDRESLAARECQLAGIELILGHVADAVSAAERSVSYAASSKSWMLRRLCTTVLADALHQAGNHGAARTRFGRAEDLLRKHQSGVAGLSSVAGFNYCELILGDSERAAWRVQVERISSIAIGASPMSSFKLKGLLQNCQSVEKRAKDSIEIAQRNNWPLDIALAHLTLGRAALYREVLSPSGNNAQLSICDTHFRNAIGGFHRAGILQYQSLALLSHAWLRVLNFSPDEALSNLDDAWEIAKLGPMNLCMADIYLTRACFFRDKPALSEARKLIERCGYRRRIDQLTDVEHAAKSW